MEEMAVNNAETKEGKGSNEQTAFLNMLYLKTIDQESDLIRLEEKLRNIQYQLIRHQTSIGDLGKYKTKMIGKIKSAAVKPKKKTSRNVIVSGGVGLIMSLCIAFFMEYIEEAKARRKGK